MRILAICPAGIVSGKEIMSLHLLKDLKSRGHKCYVITSNWGSEDFKTRLRSIGVPFSNLRVGFISKTLNWSAMRMTFIQAIYMPSLFYKYYKLKKKFKPDLIIHTNFHHAFLLYPLINKEKNIYWSHEIIANSSFYRKLFQFIGNKMKLFVAVSNATALSLTNLHVLGLKVRVIKNGTNISEVPSIKKGNSSRLVLAVVGQVSAPKGIEILLNALSILPKKLFALKIVGSGNEEYINQLKHLINKLGLSANCEWMGFVKNPEEIYRNIDVVVVPSIFPDPYPTTVMEAGLRGIPVIVSRIGGLPEMIEEGINGYLCEAGNSNSFRDGIGKLMNHPDLTSLKRTSLHFAQENFSLQRFGDNFNELITNLP